MNWRVLVLWLAVAAVTIGVFLIPPIPQSENYHHFVDTRTFGGVHNAFDVASNAFFLIVGLLGMRFVLINRQLLILDLDFSISVSAGPTLFFSSVSRSPC